MILERNVRFQAVSYDVLVDFCATLTLLKKRLKDNQKKKEKKVIKK